MLDKLGTSPLSRSTHSSIFFFFLTFFYFIFILLNTSSRELFEVPDPDHMETETSDEKE